MLSLSKNIQFVNIIYIVEILWQYFLDLCLFPLLTSSLSLLDTGYMKGAFALIFGLFILLLLGSVVIQKAKAATLGKLKDVITTSRPSAASPVSANAASGVGQLSIFNNGSRYLASDSATVMRNGGTVIASGINVVSQSAALTTVYFGTTTAAAVQNGTDVLMVPITAKHTITFNTVTTIPASGTIVVTFPGAANSNASPSASAFAFNGLVTGNVTVSGATCSGATLVVSSPTITCTAASIVTAGTTITITIGSSTPTLINPTKTAAAGTADSWTVAVRTTDASSNTLDSSLTKIATIESVHVKVSVEPTLTFTITGIPNNTNINSDGTYGVSSCGSIATNSGVGSSATSVNLGVLSKGYTSSAGQQLSVSTNASTGYVITATSSGKFMNPASGIAIPDANGGAGLTANDTPAPAVITAGTPAFGIHPCGARSSINNDQWVNAGISTAKFSNPWNTGTNAFYNTLASYSAGAVSTDKTNVVYGATISGTTPAGTYITVLTYVASATF